MAASPPDLSLPMPPPARRNWLTNLPRSLHMDDLFGTHGLFVAVCVVSFPSHSSSFANLRLSMCGLSGAGQGRRRTKCERI